MFLEAWKYSLTREVDSGKYCSSIAQVLLKLRRLTLNIDESVKKYQFLKSHISRFDYLIFACRRFVTLPLFTESLKPVVEIFTQVRHL